MKNKKILLVEDDVFLSNTLEIELKRAHMEVKIALNGEQAIKMLDYDTYDLVLLDIIMPVMDGWQVLEELMKRKVLTVIISNLSQDEDIKRAKEMGAKDFLVKSDNSLKEMIEKITNILSENPRKDVQDESNIKKAA